MAKTKKGFTIIEVVLVLALAGLIFIMVFIGLPAMRIGQRNEQRRQDINRIAAITQEYVVDHNNTPYSATDAGTLGSQLESFVTKYVDEHCSLSHNGGTYADFSGCVKQFSDPDGKPYGIFVRSFEGAGSGYISDEGDGSYAVDLGSPDGSNNGFNHYIYAIPEARCGSNEGSVYKNGGRKNFAIMYTFERGDIYCVDNN